MSLISPENTSPAKSENSHWHVAAASSWSTEQKTISCRKLRPIIINDRLLMLPDTVASTLSRIYSAKTNIPALRSKSVISMVTPVSLQLPATNVIGFGTILRKPNTEMDWQFGTALSLTKRSFKVIHFGMNLQTLYRQSIVTFTVFHRVSEILRLFVFQEPLFHTAVLSKSLN